MAKRNEIVEAQIKKRRGPRAPQEFTEEQTEHIVQMIRDGATQKEMAAYLGISPTSFRRHFRNLIGNGNAVGNKRTLWTAAHRDLVLALTGFGCTPNEIARLFRVDKETITRDFEEEIDTGAPRVNARVASALFAKAVEGNVQAQTFWLRCRAGWNDGQSATMYRAQQAAEEAANAAAETNIPVATRDNIRGFADDLSREGRKAMREVVDDLAAASARVVNP